ncbi:AAA family ATPase [Carnobacterium mobile]|uniref:AAA family ATPase n=1 Tax=Carnobacterium mobile TaxID=2750 RepID=UPI0024537B13|nr:AAA family ATPase [Carnobacterium mobile]
MFRTTIHPEYSYSDFIGQLLPYTDPSDSSKVRYTFKKGVFTEAMVEAYSDSTKRVYLILEELSRGNVSAIFGDIFQLLDRNIHFESKYSIVNKDIANEIIAFPGDRIKIPSNLNIIGTVNTNDQSVFPMDTAFKRRFDWRYISSDPAKDEHGSRIKKLNNPKLFIPIDANRSNDIETNWQSFYMVLNDYITDKQLGLGKNEDKQVGQFFIQFSSELIDKSYSSSSVEEQEAREIIKIIKFEVNYFFIYGKMWNQT